jgi:hypothetical protein
MSVVTRSGITAGGERDRHARASAGPDDAPVVETRQTRRGMSPALLQRVKMLPPRDRAIIELTLSAKLSRTHVGRALGMAPGQVSRRVRVLYGRLHDPIVLALVDDRCPLAPEYRQLGIEHFLLAQSTTQLADAHRIPAGQVRRMLTFMRGWHKGATAARP